MVSTHWIGEPSFLLTLHDISDQEALEADQQAGPP